MAGKTAGREAGASAAKPPANQEPAPKGATGRSVHRALHRYGSVYVSLIAGVLIGGLCFAFVHFAALELGVIACFLTYLISVIVRLPRLSEAFLRAHADESDIPGYFILIIALGALIAASVSLFVLLNSGDKPGLLQMGLGVVAVLLGWLTIHTMLGFHYAYEFYETDAASTAGKDGKRQHVGGLDFPGKEMPDGLSFLYFSFVVAMTAQVSDVTVTSNPMRRIVLLHGILSYFFNTVILAVAVNIVVSLGH